MGRSALYHVKEFFKSLAIVLLTCSAVYLLSRSQLFGSLTGILRPSSPVENSVSAVSDQVQAAQPLRIAVMTEGGCCGALYGSGDLSALFQRLAPLLSEALSGEEDSRQVSRQEWERALLSTPSAYFEFLGQVPLQVLSGWLSGVEDPRLSTIQARRLLLTAGEDGQVLLYYQDETAGRYFVRSASVVDLNYLQTTLSDTAANGAMFACQSSSYDQLYPYTLIAAQTPEPPVYTVSDPLEGDEDRRLNALLEALSFSPGITSVYNTPDGRRARSGNDTLSISNDSTVTYNSTDGGTRYPVPLSGGGGALFSGVECARQLVQDALGPWCGEASIALSSVQILEDGSLQTEFCYVLYGAPVLIGSRGYAARVTIDRGHITQFELTLRTYTAAGQTEQILPVKQAAAALEPLGLTGQELQLCYQDGGDTAAPAWVTR